jgi:MFS family permease
VRDGLGPYLAIYLLTVRHWDEASIGFVMSIGTVAGLLAQAPAGALVDGVAYKRALLVIASRRARGRRGVCTFDWGHHARNSRAWGFRPPDRPQ